MTWCFCQACTSLLCACCGNDKASTVPPGATSGRKRSVAVLLLCIGFALAFQYGIAPYLVDMTVSNFVQDAWLDGCDHSGDVDLQKSCAGNNGNYRASAATVLFFVLAAIAALLKSTANREAWPAKYILYVFLVAITIVIPNEPLFSDVFLNIARSTYIPSHWRMTDRVLSTAHTDSLFQLVGSSLSLYSNLLL